MVPSNPDQAAWQQFEEENQSLKPGVICITIYI
jgi:hypothetical protein